MLPGCDHTVSLRAHDRPAARTEVPGAAQVCMQRRADKTVSRSAEGANAIGFVSAFHLFFHCSQMAGLPLLANCNQVTVQNYRIF